MSATSILAISDMFRSRLAAREASTVTAMLQAFMTVRSGIIGPLDQLVADMERAQAAGEDVSLAWLFRQDRYHTLLRQVEARISELTPHYEGLITADQLDAIQTALEAFEQLTMFQLPPQAAVNVTFNRLPVSALEHLVGTLADGSPLRDLLDELGPSASKRVRDELIQGVGVGRNPRDTARRIRDALDGNQARANLISRTEQLRAHRSASIEIFDANRDVVEGWIWHSALDERTCLSCVTMHGRFFASSEVFASHPGCRCSPIPKTKSFAELGITGIPETSIDIPPGSDWFWSQPPHVRLRLAGPAKHAALESGVITLDDLAGFRVDKKWGPVRWERSLSDALGARRAREYYREAADD